MIGGAFVRDQLFFMDFGKTDLTERKVEKWSMPLGKLANGHRMDRAVFFKETCPFVACGWDGEQYAWMDLRNNNVIVVGDNEWDEITVMVPF